MSGEFEWNAQLPKYEDFVNMVRRFMALSEDQRKDVMESDEFEYGNDVKGRTKAKNRKTMIEDIKAGNDPFSEKPTKKPAKQPKKKVPKQRLTEAQYMERDELAVQVASHEGSIVANKLVHAEQQEALNKIRDREAAAAAANDARTAAALDYYGPVFLKMKCAAARVPGPRETRAPVF